MLVPPPKGISKSNLNKMSMCISQNMYKINSKLLLNQNTITIKLNTNNLYINQKMIIRASIKLKLNMTIKVKIILIRIKINSNRKAWRIYRKIKILKKTSFICLEYLEFRKEINSHKNKSKIKKMNLQIKKKTKDFLQKCLLN